MELFFYEAPLIFTCAALIIIALFFIGWSLRWKKKAHYWRDMYYEAIEPVKPPDLVDPYEGIKTALEYNWEETWD